MENEKNTVHETVEEKVAKAVEEKNKEKGEDLKDDEIIDINKEEKKESANNSSVTSKTSRKASPKSTEDFIAKQKKRKRTRTIIVLLVVAAIIIGIVLWVKNAANKAKEAFQAMNANSIETAFVEKKTLYDTKNATGTLYALETRTLSTNLGTGVATIEAVNVEVGDYVTEGDVLVKFSTENIEKTISETKEDINTQRQQDSIDAEDAQRNYVYSYTSVANSLESAAKKVDDALFELHEACDGYGTAKRKRDEIQSDIDSLNDEDFMKKYGSSKESVSRTTLESAKNAVDQAFQVQEKAQKAYDQAVEDQAKTINDSQSGGGSLSSADSTYKKSQISAGQQVKKLERSLENSIDSLDDYVVTATMSGIVTEVNVTEGNKFASGNVLTIQDDSSFKAEVTVDEYDIPKVKKAYEQAKAEGRELKVVVKTDATGDAEYAGHVTLIAPTSTSTASFANSTSNGGSSAASSGSSTANYKVSIVLDEKDDSLMIGMSAKVAIVVSESPANSLCVPYNSIKEDETGRCIVRVMDENGDHSTADDNMFGAGVDGNKGKNGVSEESKGVNGIVIENDGAGVNASDDKDSKNQNKLASKFKKNDKEPVEQGRRYREVEVEKIFETDYYAAVVPKVDGSLKEGDEIMIISEKANGNDIMAMFGARRGGGDGDF